MFGRSRKGSITERHAQGCPSAQQTREDNWAKSNWPKTRERSDAAFSGQAICPASSPFFRIEGGAGGIRDSADRLG